MSDIKLKIQIGLPTFLSEDKKLLKSISIYHVLKAMYPSSLIMNYTEKIKLLSTICKCCERTLYSRIRELRHLGLVYVKEGRLEMISYDKMNALIDFRVEKKHFHYLKLNGRPLDIFEATAIKENLQDQEIALRYKMKRDYPGLDSSIELYDYLRKATIKGQIDKFKLDESKNVEGLAYNPLITLSHKSMSALFGLKSVSGSYYKQQKLKKAMLINVKHSPPIEAKNARSFSSVLGKTFYSRKTRKHYLQMPNIISVP